MTHENFDGIKSGAAVASVRVQEGAALADYVIRKGVIEDRESPLAAQDSRSYVLEDTQVGKAAAEFVLEDIDFDAGEARLSIHERIAVSSQLLQPVIQGVLRAAGVHEARLGINNAPTDQLRSIGFHAVGGASETLAFAS